MWDAENNDSLIRPCPFCGGEAEPDPTCTDELEHCLQCNNCRACIYYSHEDYDDFKQAVITAWNRRTG